MYEHVKTGCKHIPPSEQPLQFQSGYFLNKPHTTSEEGICYSWTEHWQWVAPLVTVPQWYGLVYGERL